MYTSGAATTLTNLIDAIRVFCVAQGWTNNHYSDDGAGKRLHLSKGSVFVNFRTTANENFSAITDLATASNLNSLWVNISTGFDSSATAWYKQTGAINRFISPPSNNNPRYDYTGIVNITGSVTYHLFSFDNQIYVIIENPAGIFHWLGFGSILKIGDWGGGEFLFGKHNSSSSVNTTKTFPFFGQSYAGIGASRGFLRVNSFDSSSGWARTDASLASGNYRPERLADSIQKMKTLWEVSPNLFSQKPVLLPISLLMTRDLANFSTAVPFSLMGILPNIFFINMSGIIPASEYADGTGSIYRVFPFHQKIDELANTGSSNSTGTLGFAIKSN